MKTFVIAEISANHRQNKERTMQLIRAAADADADAVKFQTYRPEDFVEQGIHTIPSGIWKGMDMYDLYSRGQLPWEFHEELFAYAQNLGLQAFSTPFSIEALQFLESIGCPRYKIASLEMGYYPLIEAAAVTGKPLIISTGAAKGHDDILKSVSAAEDAFGDDIEFLDLTLLKCTSKYPTPTNEVNLATLDALANAFGYRVGISDHTTSTLVPAISVAAGATVIEKHLDLDDKAGLDGAFSLNPDEFRQMVENIKLAEEAIGTATFAAPEETYKYRRRQDKNGKWLRFIPEEKPTKAEKIAMKTVTSSNIKGAGYNIGQNILRIEFQNGGVYNYYEVPKDIFEGLVSAESAGKFFHKNIKNKYKYKRTSSEGK